MSILKLLLKFFATFYESKMVKTIIIFILVVFDVAVAGLRIA